MYLFCTSRSALTDDDENRRFAPPTRSRPPRLRQSSVPTSNAVGTAVRRVASVGGRRTLRGPSGFSKAIIGHPTNFVHLTHLDSADRERELTALDPNRLVPQSTKNGKLAQFAPIVPITDVEPQSGKMIERCQVTTSNPSVTLSLAPGAPDPSLDLPSSSEAKTVRRASLMKRKPVPTFEEPRSISDKVDGNGARVATQKSVISVPQAIALDERPELLEEHLSHNESERKNPPSSL